jgi:endonuclease/exonuclease/phosphatase family metal-dependent hydrolase
MPAITDVPPQDVAADLQRLRTALDEDLPAKTLDRNLLVATWNLREFGGLTEKWRAAPSDSPKRDLHSLLAITEIVSRFDVIALQEVQGSIKSLRHMMKVLGPDWAFTLTDVTRGDAGGGERMAFVFDTRRVKMSGLAGELVVPPEWLDDDDPNALSGQFARTPYAVSFLSQGQTFVLVTLHVLWGDSADQRTPELAGVARWMADWARQEAEWNHNLIVLGDFNIDRKGDPNYEVFVSTGLTVPAELEGLPRTIFTTDPEKLKFYDQIAWFTTGSSRLLSLGYHGSAGSFDFVPHVLTDLDRRSLSFRISDHYPLWAEFSV